MSEREKHAPTTEKREGGKRFPALLCSASGTLLILGVIALLLPPVLLPLLGIRVCNVVSGSMEPAIPAGSVIFVRPTEAEAVGEGDVIAFSAGGVVVAHRVVENRKLERRFVTKGDANEQADQKQVGYEALLGRVAYRIPLLGEITARLTTPPGKLCLFALLLCGLLLNLIAARLGEARERGAG